MSKDSTVEYEVRWPRGGNCYCQSYDHAIRVGAMHERESGEPMIVKHERRVLPYVRPIITESAS